MQFRPTTPSTDHLNSSHRRPSRSKHLAHLKKLCIYPQTCLSRTYKASAVIARAADGIGRETAYAFAEASAAGILFADINEHGAKESAETSKKFATHADFRALGLKVDISDVESVQNMVNVAKREFGRIDYSVNSTGIGRDTNSIIPDLDIAEFDKIHRVHTKGTMLVTRAVSKAMIQQEEKIIPHRNGARNLGRGVIVNVASLFSLIAIPGHLPYISAKHAATGIVKSGALELAPHGICVNGICPSWVDTPLLAEDRKQRPEVNATITANPFNRPAEPDEIADAIIFLCSPQATCITASDFVVDAGLTINAPTH